MPQPPTVASIGHGLLHWGVPLVGGAAGFIAGDLFGANQLADEISGGFLTGGQIPFQTRFAYEAFAGAGIYAIAVGIIAWVGTKVPAGGIVRDVVLKTLKWFLYGIIAREMIAGLLPSKMPATGTITLPAIAR